MANIRSKRPSSARRNIKQESFSPFASSTRVRHVQSLLKDGCSPGDTSPEAVLCILGIDGRYNEGSRELAGYLLFGFFDSRKTELERSGFEEEVIDDMIFLISKHGVDVYCNPINYHYLLPYMAHWRNLHIHCLTDAQYQDEEKAEEFKIQSFIAMVEGYATVGMPYSSTGQRVDFDKMAMEKWPIVQAYALEGFGGGGFFTLKHEVLDISTHLHQLYQLMDPVAIETLVTEHLPLFERHWSNMLTICDVHRSEKAKNLTEGLVCEPLMSYFSHGRVVSAKGERSMPGRQPFVLFGCHTCRGHLEVALRVGISFNSDLSSTGVQNTPAKHMICQAVSPRGPLSCTRTYFFSTGVEPLPVSGQSVPTSCRHAKKSDTRLLIEVYLACIEAALRAVKVYASTLSLKQSEDVARRTLQMVCQAGEVPLNPSLFQSSKHVQFCIDAYDNQNRQVSLTEGHWSPHVKTVGVTVYDIPSLEHPGTTLGSVSFGETFMDSVLHVGKPDGQQELDGVYAMLTGCVPYFISAMVLEDEQRLVDDLVSELRQCVDDHPQLGRKLIPGEEAILTVDGSGATRPTIVRGGSLFVFEEGLVYQHSHHGLVVLPKSQLTAVYFYDGDSPSTVALMVLSYREQVRAHLPLHLRSDHYRLIVALEPRSRAYKAAFSQVLPLWKQEEKPVFEQLAELPEELLSLHQMLQKEYDAQTKLPPGVSTLKQATARLPDLARLMEHFAVSSVGEQVVCSKHLPAVLAHDVDLGTFEDKDELIVSVVTGVPGSHKEALCRMLTRLDKQQSILAVLKHPADSSRAFSRHSLQASLTGAWQAQRKRRSAATGHPPPPPPVTKMRVLLITSGFTDIVDVVQAIVNHPDNDVASHLRIGAVTACLDPLNAFLSDHYSLPKLLDQCAQGWVNTIALTGPLSQQEDQLATVQHLIRSVNSDVAFVLAPGGDLSRNGDVDLMLSATAFDQGALIRARYLSCPRWWQGEFDSGAVTPAVDEVLVRFSQPLEKSRLTNRLKALKGAESKYPYQGDVLYVCGTVAFTDCPQLCELQYTVKTGALSCVPAAEGSTGPASQSCAMVFLGFALDQEKMRDWLRGCAKPKPERKMARSRDSLTNPEINRVHKLHHLDALPEGWFYNGSKFVSLDGDKCSTHPSLEQFLAEYLDKANQEVDAYNKWVNAQEYHDLFE